MSRLRDVSSMGTAVLALLATGTLSGIPPAKAWPVENGHVVASFGGEHHGIDIEVAPRAPVLAYAAGVVEARAVDRHGVAFVRVRHAGAAASTLYCNLADIRVSVGETVNAGTPLASVIQAPAGRKTHLHFELELDGEKVDPLAHLPRSPA